MSGGAENFDPKPTFEVIEQLPELDGEEALKLEPDARVCYMLTRCEPFADVESMIQTLMERTGLEEPVISFALRSLATSELREIRWGVDDDGEPVFSIVLEKRLQAWLEGSIKEVKPKPAAPKVSDRIKRLAAETPIPGYKGEVPLRIPSDHMHYKPGAIGGKKQRKYNPPPEY